MINYSFIYIENDKMIIYFNAKNDFLLKIKIILTLISFLNRGVLMNCYFYFKLHKISVKQLNFKLL